MATFHLSIKSGKKGSAASHAAYISRTGKFGKKLDLVAQGFGNLPEWAGNDPSHFWRMADKHERSNGSVYREFEVALPRELTLEQQQVLVDRFIDVHIGQKPYQFAMHCPSAALDSAAQPHAHILVSDRTPDGIDRPSEQHFRRFNRARPELGGCRKDTGGESRTAFRQQAVRVRESWAQMTNSALEQHGHVARVDHRSHKARGLDCQPERHLGQAGIQKMSNEEKEQFKARRAK